MIHHSFMPDRKLFAKGFLWRRCTIVLCRTGNYLRRVSCRGDTQWHHVGQETICERFPVEVIYNGVLSVPAMVSCRCRPFRKSLQSKTPPHKEAFLIEVSRPPFGCPDSDGVSFELFPQRPRAAGKGSLDSQVASPPTNPVRWCDSSSFATPAGGDRTIRAYIRATYERNV